MCEDDTQIRYHWRQHLSIITVDSEICGEVTSEIGYLSRNPWLVYMFSARVIECSGNSMFKYPPSVHHDYAVPVN